MLSYVVTLIWGVTWGVRVLFGGFWGVSWGVRRFGDQKMTAKLVLNAEPGQKVGLGNGLRLVCD